jgi:nucleoside-diphosphate-sugar epimerase
MERVLVTGGTGFFGQHLVKRLLGCNKYVRVLTRPRNNGASRDPVNKLIGIGAEIVWGDIRDYNALKEAAADVDLIFHLAGRLLITGISSTEYEQLHVSGTRNLLSACRDSTKLQSIVYCSSTGVLGPTGRSPVNEDSSVKPSNVYEETKAVGEKLALKMAENFNLAVTVARPSMAYGPGDLHLLNWFRAIKKGYFRIVGDGENLLHPIYIDDVIDGLLKCAYTPGSSGKIYHIVGKKPVSIKEFANQIASSLACKIPNSTLPVPVAMGIASLLESFSFLSSPRLPLTRSRIMYMTENRVYSGEKAKEELGFLPSVDLNEGIERTVVWYRKKGLL